ERTRHNILRGPIHLVFRNPDVRSTAAQLYPCKLEHAGSAVRYTITGPGGNKVVWTIETSGAQWRMRVAASGGASDTLGGIDVVFPLDPKTSSTSIVAGNWSKSGQFSLPAI